MAFLPSAFKYPVFQPVVLNAGYFSFQLAFTHSEGLFGGVCLISLCLSWFSCEILAVLL